MVMVLRRMGAAKDVSTPMAPCASHTKTVSPIKVMAPFGARRVVTYFLFTSRMFRIHAVCLSMGNTFFNGAHTSPSISDTVSASRRVFLLRWARAHAPMRRGSFPFAQSGPARAQSLVLVFDPQSAAVIFYPAQLSLSPGRLRHCTGPVLLSREQILV